MQRLFVSSDNKVTIKCPHCWHSREVDLARLVVCHNVLKVKCTCNSIFNVELEFRKKNRKKTDLQGFYFNPAQKEKIPDLSRETHLRAVNCSIRNLSMHGVGFVTLQRHSIKKDDQLIVKFMLDNAVRLLIEKNVIVRVVNGNYIGCEFFKEEQNDAGLGFYAL